MSYEEEIFKIIGIFIHSIQNIIYIPSKGQLHYIILIQSGMPVGGNDLNPTAVQRTTYFHYELFPHKAEKPPLDNKHIVFAQYRKNF